MRAVVLRGTCAASGLKVEEAPLPTAKPGWVLVKVKAFGLNHSESIMRSVEADVTYIHLPRIMGIECVGEIEDPSDSHFVRGQRVAALMGGMGKELRWQLRRIRPPAGRHRVRRRKRPGVDKARGDPRDLLHRLLGPVRLPAARGLRIPSSCAARRARSDWPRYSSRKVSDAAFWPRRAARENSICSARAVWTIP